MFTEEDKFISRIASESRFFVFDNLKVLQGLFLPFLPFIILCDVADSYLIRNHENSPAYFSYISMMLYGVLGLSWHKFVMKGPDSDYKTSIFSLNENDLKFLGFLFVLSLPGLVLELLKLVGILSSDVIAITVILLLVFSFLTIWISLRISCFFPAAAYGEPMSFNKAFKVGSGLPLRLFCSNFLALWRIMLILILSIIVFSFLVRSSDAIVLFINTLSILFNPIITVICVTVLSKYYLTWRADTQSEVL